eukprot:scaffold201342_cov26-Tisochrysis_lutea.AAC.2
MLPTIACSFARELIGGPMEVRCEKVGWLPSPAAEAHEGAACAVGPVIATGPALVPVATSLKPALVGVAAADPASSWPKSPARATCSTRIAFQCLSHIELNASMCL